MSAIELIIHSLLKSYTQSGR